MLSFPYSFILIFILHLVVGKQFGGSYGTNKLNRTNHGAVLDSRGDFQVHWLKHPETKEIEFRVEVRARGWFGFGISPNGGMINSDIVIGWIDDSGVTHFHVSSNSLKFRVRIQGHSVSVDYCG